MAHPGVPSDDHEDISLELEHVADLLGALAQHAERPMAGALWIAERCLHRLAARVDALRSGARPPARGVREMPRPYLALVPRESEARPRSPELWPQARAACSFSPRGA